jgi:hypothetical protein
MLTLQAGDSLELIIRHRGVPYAKTYRVYKKIGVDGVIGWMKYDLTMDIVEDLAEEAKDLSGGS